MLDAAAMSDREIKSRMSLRPATEDDAPRIAALHQRVFGPGRFARSAYRVREAIVGRSPQVSDFCRVAHLGSRLVAALRMSEIAIGGGHGAALLGPLAVDPDFAGQGFGRALISEALEAARAKGIALVVLVGDEPYYGRFGFRPVPPGQVTFPGPVNPARILAVELAPEALARFCGLISAV